MNGNVTYEGSTLLSGAINVNAGGNIEALNVQVTENGSRTITATSGVDGYSPITIETNVPIPEPVLDSISITENGTYTPPTGTDGYNEISVNVPSYTPNIQSLTKTISSNGVTTLHASDVNCDGFDPVTIRTEVPEPVLDILSVTQNGTYTAPSGTGYNEVSVNVPAPENALVIKNYESVPTSIASFNDGTSNPLKSLTASIEPVQSGSGDPSPTNVRPISGWTEEVVSVCGKNLAKKTIHCYIKTDTSKVVIDNDSESAVFYAIEGETYTISSSVTMNRSTVGLTDTDNITNQYPIINFIDLGNSVTWTATWTGWTIWYKCSSGNSDFANSVQIELGNQATTYEPYAGTTTTIPFTDSQGNPVEVFGGSVDVVDGVVTPCPYYASYNGEQLTGEWISDRDVYSPNTSPSIGAQVVNIGATGTPFSAQPTAVKSLDGENNVFASTGDVEELKYFADL